MGIAIYFYREDISMRKFFATILMTILVFSFVSASIAEAYEQEEIVQTTVIMTANVDTELRLWATNDGPAYATLVKGDDIEVFAFYPDENHVWAQVSRDEEDLQYKYGYANVEDLYFSSGKQFKLGKYMKITGNTVNIREEGNIQADTCGLLHKGDVVSVEKYVPTSDGRIWAYCSNAKTTEYLGWVSMRYLTPKN